MLLFGPKGNDEQGDGRDEAWVEEGGGGERGQIRKIERGKTERKKMKDNNNNKDKNNSTTHSSIKTKKRRKKGKRKEDIVAQKSAKRKTRRINKRRTKAATVKIDKNGDRITNKNGRKVKGR